MSTIWSRFTCGGREATKPMTSATSSAVSGGEALVDGVGALLIAGESHEREVGLDHARGDLGETHRLAEEFAAQGAVGDRLSVFGRGVAGTVVVGLQRGDGGDGDDQSVPPGRDERGG